MRKRIIPRSGMKSVRLSERAKSRVITKAFVARAKLCRFVVCEAIYKSNTTQVAIPMCRGKGIQCLPNADVISLMKTCVTPFAMQHCSLKDCPGRNVVSRSARMYMLIQFVCDILQRCDRQQDCGKK